MKNKKTTIIAEVGVNHNGSIKLAKKLIDVSKKSHADYVKFQIYKAQELVKEKTKTAIYQKKNTKIKYQFNLLKDLELTKKNFKEIANYCKKKKINLLLSPFDTESLSFIFQLKIFDIKIPSGEINNYILLKKIAQKAKKIFLSTGMSTLKEVIMSVNILTKHGAKKKNIVVLHCHSDYPTELTDVNLLAMKEMQKKIKIDVGYSDHTLGCETAISAVALGATVLEKHITLSKKMSGPDHKASMEPQGFATYVDAVRKTEILLGSSDKKASNKELKTKLLVRKSIVARKNINKGEKFTELNITCKRPEGGISAIHWPKAIGKKSNFFFKKDEFIKFK